MTVPMMLPRPPNMLTPPMITAAIDWSRSSGSPAIEEPPLKRAVCKQPAMPAVMKPSA